MDKKIQITDITKDINKARSGIIMAEVLGKPRCMQTYRSKCTKRPCEGKKK